MLTHQTRAYSKPRLKENWYAWWIGIQCKEFQLWLRRVFRHQRTHRRSGTHCQERSLTEPVSDPPARSGVKTEVASWGARPTAPPNWTPEESVVALCQVAQEGSAGAEGQIVRMSIMNLSARTSFGWLETRVKFYTSTLGFLAVALSDGVFLLVAVGGELRNRR